MVRMIRLRNIPETLGSDLVFVIRGGCKARARTRQATKVMSREMDAHKRRMWNTPITPKGRRRPTEQTIMRERMGKCRSGRAKLGEG